MQAALDLATAAAAQARLQTEMNAQAADSDAAARLQYQELQMVMMTAAQKPTWSGCNWRCGSQLPVRRRRLR